MTNEPQIQNDATNKKEYFNVGIVVLVLLLVTGIVVFELLSTDPVDSTTPNMSEIQARAIAERTCVKGGEVLGQGEYNENTKTWWFDANLNATQEGCNPACVVSGETKTAEINWRCTGLVDPKDPIREKPGLIQDPIACTMEAKLCPDGSAVGRVGPNCEFAPCPQVQERSTASTVVLNQSIMQNGVTIIPLEVLDDSRCPVDVSCVWTGAVTIRASVQDDTTQEVVNIVEKEQFLFGDKYILLEDVYPLPSPTEKISPNDYIFKIRIVSGAEFSTMRGIGEE
jgi:hypothetical protein